MSIQYHSNCPNCNAPLPKISQDCEYCGSSFFIPDTELNTYSKKNNLNNTKDFGISNTKYIFFILVCSAILYGLGWRYEDFDYLLNDIAVIIWAGVLPLWLAATAFVWKTAWGQWLPGFAISIPIFLLHLLILWMIKGRINDDALGISTLFAIASLLGWFFGRILHNSFRKMRAKSKLRN